MIQRRKRVRERTRGRGKWKRNEQRQQYVSKEQANTVSKKEFARHELMLSISKDRVNTLGRINSMSLSTRTKKA